MDYEWMKIRDSLSRCYDVVAIGKAVKIPRQHVVGCLVDVWAFARGASVDGFLSGFTLKEIDKIAEKKGFAQAMLDVGWLSIAADGIRFPNWDRWNINGSRSRELNAVRQRAYRVRHKSSDPNSNVTRNVTRNAECNAPVTPKVTGSALLELRIENSESEEEKDKPPRAASAAPPSGGRMTRKPELSIVWPVAIDTPESRAAWDRWNAYRRERRLPVLKTTSTNTQLAKFAPMGPLVFIASIEQSIANGYQGLFEPKAVIAAPWSQNGESPAQKNLRIALEANP